MEFLISLPFFVHLHFIDHLRDSWLLQLNQQQTFSQNCLVLSCTGRDWKDLTDACFIWNKLSVRNTVIE